MFENTLLNIISSSPRYYSLAPESLPLQMTPWAELYRKMRSLKITITWAFAMSISQIQKHRKVLLLKIQMFFAADMRYPTITTKQNWVVAWAKSRHLWREYSSRFLKRTNLSIHLAVEDSGSVIDVLQHVPNASWPKLL